MGLGKRQEPVTVARWDLMATWAVGGSTGDGEHGEDAGLGLEVEAPGQELELRGGDGAGQR